MDVNAVRNQRLIAFEHRRRDGLEPMAPPSLAGVAGADKENILRPKEAEVKFGARYQA